MSDSKQEPTIRGLLIEAAWKVPLYALVFGASFHLLANSPIAAGIWETYCRPVLWGYIVIALSYKIIKYEVNAIREKGWRGMFVVQAADFIYMIGLWALYGLLAGLLFTVITAWHRLGLPLEAAKDEWVDEIRRQPLEDRTDGWWVSRIWLYKAWVRWDHDEALMATDHYRNLTKRRREWIAQVSAVTESGPALANAVTEGGE